MNNNITVSQALAIPHTSLPACRFAHDDQSRRSDAWATLRDMQQTGETAVQACGSPLIFSAVGLEPSNVIPDCDHYSVEGEPGTWTTHQELGEAFARAKQLGLTQVWGVRYTVHASGQSGVDKRSIKVGAGEEIAPDDDSPDSERTRLADAIHDRDKYDY